MDILVTTVSVNSRGKKQREQRRLPGPLLTIGRGTQCQIHLPDPRVALEHARLTVSEVGARIAAEGGSVQVNGRPTDGAQLDVGDQIEIGPYVLVVEPPRAGFSVSFVVQAVAARPEGSLLRRVRLLSPRTSMRRLSWLAFTGTLAVFLVGPAATDFLGEEIEKVPDTRFGKGPELVRALATGLQQWWNPGPLSRGHRVMAADCRACHELPFVRVRDEACLACHGAIREHVPRANFAAGRAPQRCAECHRDHQGVSLARHSQELCVACHADVDAAAAKATTRNVSDFGRDHPPFRLSLPDPDRPGHWLRVRQATIPSGVLVERSGLKFNHALHMDPMGVRDPRGYRDPAGLREASGRRKVLQCGDCHVPHEDGRLMQPISMEKHCRGCHSLAFEPSVTSRQAPHAEPKEVATMLREFYARLVLGEQPADSRIPTDLPRWRPGAVLTPEERAQALAIADQRASRVIRELFQARGVCGTCHEVRSVSESPGWHVRPVHLAKQWMPAARFTHAKHDTMPCAVCHEALSSRKATDVVMPRLAGCRGCHTGASAVQGMVSSLCADCHGFHTGAGRWHSAPPAEAKRENAR